MIGLGLYEKVVLLLIKVTRAIGDRANSLERKLYQLIGAGEGPVLVRMPVSHKMVTLELAGDVRKTVLLDGILAYERETVAPWQALCRSADVVLDIGAHVGVFSLLAADAAMTSQIFAFEPLPQNFRLLCRNLHAAGVEDRVKAYPLALSDCEGSRVLVVRGSSGSTLEEDFWVDSSMLPRVTVETITLDRWLSSMQITLSKKSVIKIDVETHEPAVLRGSKLALDAGAAIFCEVLATFTETELRKLLRPDHWRYFWIGPDGPSERREIVGDPSWKWMNYLFLRNDSPYLSAVQSGYVNAR